MPYPANTLDEILARIDHSGGWDACWPWLGAKLKPPGDYGVVRYQGKKHKVPRLVWSLAYGEIPAGLCVLHHCDHPWCCNWTRCLFLGTHKDNAEDKVKKGREFRWEGREHWTATASEEQLRRFRIALAARSFRGEDNPRAKLTTEQVAEIRAAPAYRGLNRDLAARYGVSPGHISNIRRGWLWRD